MSTTTVTLATCSEYCAGGYRTDFLAADHYGEDTPATRRCDAGEMPCPYHRCYRWDDNHTAPMTRTGDYRERYAVGLSQGWAHAAFVDAYGPEHDRPAPTYDGDNATPAEVGYADGWTEGVERYRSDRWADGTPHE